MQLLRAHPSRIMKVPIYATGNVNNGAVLMPGVTAATDLSAFILASGAAANAIGLTSSAYVFATQGSSKPSDGSSYVEQEIVKIQPGDEIAAVYDQSSVISVTSFSGATYTITSLENTINGSWLYAVGGTSAGLLSFLITSSAGSAVGKSTPATAPDSTTTVIKILREGHALLTLNSTADKLGTAAAAGSLTWKVIRNEININGAGWVRMNPTIHDNLTGLGVAVNGVQQTVQFRAILTPRGTFYGAAS